MTLSLSNRVPLGSAARDFGTKMISHTCYTSKRRLKALNLLKGTLVSSGHLNKRTQTGRLKQKFIFSVLEAGSPRSRQHQGWSLGRPLLLACRLLPSYCVLPQPSSCMLAEGERTSGVPFSFSKDTDLLAG